MNDYFIHTVEYYRLLDRYEYEVLKECRAIKGKKAISGIKYTHYAKYGIIMILRRCNQAERMSKKDSYGKLIVEFNPSRVFKWSAYTNKIQDVYDLNLSIEIFEKKIHEIFDDAFNDGCYLEDFVLSRADVTRDIHGIPENIVQEFILTLRRLPLSRGYKPNEQLEKNCTQFRKQDSINLLNESKGIEFVIYNKHQAAVDNYPVREQSQYSNTIRMEIRCKRKFINKFTKDVKKENKLKYIYNKMDIIASEALFVFNYDYNSSFLSHYWLTKLINKRISGNKKKENMHHLVNYLHRNPDKTLDYMLNGLFPSKNSQKTIMSSFSDIELSPIAIKSPDIPFIQSINSMLELKSPSSMEERYYNYISKKTRKSEVFIHNETS